MLKYLVYPQLCKFERSQRVTLWIKLCIRLDRKQGSNVQNKLKCGIDWHTQISTQTEFLTVTLNINRSILLIRIVSLSLSVGTALTILISVTTVAALLVMSLCFCLWKCFLRKESKFVSQSLFFVWVLFYSSQADLLPNSGDIYWAGRKVSPIQDGSILLLAGLLRAGVTHWQIEVKIRTQMLGHLDPASGSGHFKRFSSRCHCNRFLNVIISQ